MNWPNFINRFFRSKDIKKHCKRCGKALSDPRSVVKEYGPVCERKIEARKQLSLFEY